MELEDKLAEPAWCLGMSYHHQDDGNTFADGYGGIALHGLKHEGEQMAEPSLELMPRVLTLLQILSRHVVTFLSVLNKFVFQLVSRLWVDNQRVDLIIEAQTAGIKVRTAHCAVFPINHHNLGVVEPRTVAPDTGTTLGQFLHVIDDYIGHEGDIILRRDQDIHLDTSLCTTLQCLDNR